MYLTFQNLTTTGGKLYLLEMRILTSVLKYATFAYPENQKPFKCTLLRIYMDVSEMDNSSNIPVLVIIHLKGVFVFEITPISLHKSYMHIPALLSANGIFKIALST